MLADGWNSSQAVCTNSFATKLASIHNERDNEMVRHQCEIIKNLGNIGYSFYPPLRCWFGLSGTSAANLSTFSYSDGTDNDFQDKNVTMNTGGYMMMHDTTSNWFEASDTYIFASVCNLYPQYSNNYSFAPTIDSAVSTTYPTSQPTLIPTAVSTADPTEQPTVNPTAFPTVQPTKQPTGHPTAFPIINPAKQPTINPTAFPTTQPTKLPTINPTAFPTINPAKQPTMNPTDIPTTNPTKQPTNIPYIPTIDPTKNPSFQPTKNISNSTLIPTFLPTFYPTIIPTASVSIRKNENYSMFVNIAIVISVVLSLILFICCLIFAYFYRKNKKLKSDLDIERVNSHMIAMQNILQIEKIQNLSANEVNHRNQTKGNVNKMSGDRMDANEKMEGEEYKIYSDEGNEIVQETVYI